MYSRKTIDGLKTSLDNDLKLRVVEHRNRFLRIIIGRYKELLPFLIDYENIKDTSIDTVQLEYLLRKNYNVVIGQAKNNKIMILGYINNYKRDNSVIFDEFYKKEDIVFTIPKHLIPKDMKYISYYDDATTGNFIVVKNKYLNYVSDYEILNHYAIELAEISLSRFSVILQSKINTFFIGNPNDETINQLVSDLYNGSPYVKVSKFFDTRENIHTLENNTYTILETLKKEYQNKLAELNNMLGINAVAIEKKSGVSDTEAKSNNPFVTANSNIYIETRQEEFNKLNKRFGLDIRVFYNDDIQNNILSIGGGGIDESNNIINGNISE